MNSFCALLTDVIRNKFNIDAIVFVSQKRSIFIFPWESHFTNILITDAVSFIKKYFEDKKMFCSSYVLNFPRLNQSIKWRHDYILAVKRKNRKWTICSIDFLIS